MANEEEEQEIALGNALVSKLLSLFSFVSQIIGKP